MRCGCVCAAAAAAAPDPVCATCAPQTAVDRACRQFHLDTVARLTLVPEIHRAIEYLQALPSPPSSSRRREPPIDVRRYLSPEPPPDLTLYSDTDSGGGGDDTDDDSYYDDELGMGEADAGGAVRSTSRQSPGSEFDAQLQRWRDARRQVCSLAIFALCVKRSV